MRRMYSEKQVEELAQKKVQEMIASGQIKSGTQLEAIVLNLDENGDNFIRIIAIKDEISDGEVKNGLSIETYDTILNIICYIDNEGYALPLISYDISGDDASVELNTINMVGSQAFTQYEFHKEELFINRVDL